MITSQSKQGNQTLFFVLPPFLNGFFRSFLVQAGQKADFLWVFFSFFHRNNSE